MKYKYTHFALLVIVLASFMSCDENNTSKKKKTDQIEQTRKSVVGDKSYNIMNYRSSPKSAKPEANKNTE